MKIDNKYDMGDIVYIKMDKEQQENIVLGINVRPNWIEYYISNGKEGNYCYDMELSSTKDIIKQVI